MTADELRQADSETRQEIEDQHQRIAVIARTLIVQAGHQCSCRNDNSLCPLCRLKDLVAEIEKNPWPLM